MKRKLYTREARDKLIAQFHDSGFRSRTRFANEKGVNPKTFIRWLANAHKLKGDQSAAGVKFVAVEAAPTSNAVSTKAVIELRVREVSLHLPTTISAAFLAEFVALLAERPSC